MYDTYHHTVVILTLLNIISSCVLFYKVSNDSYNNIVSVRAISIIKTLNNNNIDINNKKEKVM